MERLEEELIRRSEPESLVSVTVGRFMSTLLSARPKKLRESISGLSPDSPKRFLRLSLWFLEKCVRDAAERDEAMSDILLPIIEHTLRFRDSKHGNAAMILLNRLFQDEVLFPAVSGNLSKIILRNEDRFLALGWCLLIRRLVECEDTGDQGFWHGIRGKTFNVCGDCFILCASLVDDFTQGKDGYEVPSRLSVSAADCLLSITGPLTKRDNTLVNRPKPLTITGPRQPVALIPNISEKRKKQTSRPEDSNSLKFFILWNHLEELTCLVQCLFAWNRKTRILHAKGLSQVLKWLEELKEHHGGSEKEPRRYLQVELNCSLLVGSTTASCFTLLFRKLSSGTF